MNDQSTKYRSVSMRFKFVIGLVGFLVTGIIMTLFSLKAASSNNQSAMERSPQYQDGKFINEVAAMDKSFANFKAMMKEYLFVKHPRTTPVDEIPVQTLTSEMLASLDHAQSMVYRLGHSTLLIWLNGEFWLTDPVFSERASPYQFMGPKRFHQPPISIEDLPPIKGVILSHNHYDHLDKGSIKKLLNKVEHYLVPLGIGGDLQKWGVRDSQITELDWWQSTNIAGVEFTATPAQHFSGRSMGDGDKTLWASWSIKGQDKNLFFSGDSGYFKGFKEIGERLGPFDMTFMETGAYNKMWTGVHMIPKESLQAHIDVRGDIMVPIHNGTFNLALHSWDDPFISISKLAAEANVPLLIPEMGQPVDLSNIPALQHWWQGLN